MNIVRAFVGLYRLQVCHVAHDRVLAKNAVGAVEVTCGACDIERHGNIVALCVRDVAMAHLAFVLKLAKSEVKQMRFSDIRVHLCKTLLHKLESTNGAVKLNATLRVVDA